ncbi:MAG TPA: hypothetical protein VFJ98_01035 [Mycobacteriales bacterium]|nr:hypothetical protein [Mycobacteriales bacterium]
MTRDTLLDVAGHVALLLLGAALGVWGTFLVPYRLPGGVEGLSVAIAVVTNLAAARLGGYGFGTALAAAVPGLGWLVTVLVLNAGVPGRITDDVLIPGRLDADPGIVVVGTSFLAAGAVAAVAGVLWAARRLRPTPPGTTPPG